MTTFYRPDGVLFYDTEHGVVLNLPPRYREMEQKIADKAMSYTVNTLTKRARKGTPKK